ncbi:hypothetical protein C475_02126 [Halosimplex carlsbadense 2-9-1]|uniref:DUF4013 domain-containing protein n=1 Tax=Halosimplex carlsbadense 2-9-1 TaxID=797114 RepID=M0D2G0_9EURY|nr:hypothetical protein [Halosimplex carlsbadense]ELZ29706.1 hypothetical protein C475_02126 [Halosimplex carlsbadense 2-9-1]
MPSRFDRAVAVTEESLSLAWIPAAATLLSGSQVARALAAEGGGGVTFPFPAGLPTLWTYVSLPSGPAGVGTGGPLSAALVVPLFLVGLLVTSALEAGFLGALNARIDGEPGAFADAVRRYTLRIVGVNVIRFGVVLVAIPFLILPPVGLLVVLALSYLVYGLPFAVVVADADLGTALDETVERAKAGGEYAEFGVAHLVAGAAGSFVLSGAVRTLGPVGVVFGTAVVAVPAVIVAAYGLLLFRDFRPSPRGRSHGGDFGSGSTGDAPSGRERTERAAVDEFVRDTPAEVDGSDDERGTDQ